jgi:outer membrane protein
MTRTFFFFNIIFFKSILFSQDTLTLQSCLDLVKKNNYLFTSENASKNKAQLNSKLLKWSLLPTLSSNNNFTTTFGRRVDPFTNTFTTNSANSQSFGLNSSLSIFNGFSYYYSKKKLALDYQKSLITRQQKENDIKLKVIDLFFEACKQQELIRINKASIEKQQKLKKIQKALYLEGKISLIDTLKTHNSYLNELQQQLSLFRQFNKQRIELNYLTELPLEKQVYYDLKSVSTIEEKVSLPVSFEAQKLQIEHQIVEEQLKLDRAAILPSLNLYGSLGTGFSTNNKDYSSINTPTISFTDQVNNNLYESISLNLNIPLFNKLEFVKSKRFSAITKQELDLKEKGLILEIEKINVQQKEEQLTLNAQIILTESLIQNLSTIYEKMVLIYKEGKISYFELVATMNELSAKEIDLINYRLEYLKQHLIYN